MRRRGHADIYPACFRCHGGAYGHDYVSEIAKVEEGWREQKKA